jgi:hypothetical protein
MTPDRERDHDDHGEDRDPDRDDAALHANSVRVHSA